MSSAYDINPFFAGAFTGSTADVKRKTFAAAPFGPWTSPYRRQAQYSGQEIHIAGDYAFCWNQLYLTVTPLQGGPVQRARWSHVVSLPLRARRTLDSLS